MRNFHSLLPALFLIALMIPSAASCDKTAENTNKPVIIEAFKFTVNGEVTTPVGTLQIEPSSVLTITVEYTDPDAGDSPDPSWYSYTWSVERIGGNVSLFNPNEYFVVNDENPCIWIAPDVTGFFRFRIEVRDRYQTPSMQTVVIEVNANKQPQITNLNVSNATPFVNQEVTITVTASDPDGNLPLKFTWQATGGYFVSESEGKAVWVSPVSGTFTITVIVEDQAGGSTSRNIPIIVQENHDPVINGWNIDPGNSVKVNQLVTITLDAEDIDGDILEYNWSADSGTFNTVNKNVAIWRAPNEPFSCTVTCIVKDNKGGSATAEIVILVSE
ncbi:MAG TPA: hypothetical protein ENN67_08090 [Firmicutes bacterium]|nr:hypothetical protein [Bacillota bacterium]